MVQVALVAWISMVASVANFTWISKFFCKLSCFKFFFNERSIFFNWDFWKNFEKRSGSGRFGGKLYVNFKFLLQSILLTFFVLNERSIFFNGDFWKKVLENIVIQVASVATTTSMIVFVANYVRNARFCRAQSFGLLWWLE